jgi:hypothetical protein
MLTVLGRFDELGIRVEGALPRGQTVMQNLPNDDGTSRMSSSTGPAKTCLWHFAGFAIACSRRSPDCEGIDRRSKPR